MIQKKNALLYLNHVFLFGQPTRGSSKVDSKLNRFFHDALYCCVRYSNIKYQDESLKFMIKCIASKTMAKYGFGRRFHDLKYFKVGFCHIP